MDSKPFYGLAIVVQAKTYKTTPANKYIAGFYFVIGRSTACSYCLLNRLLFPKWALFKVKAEEICKADFNELFGLLF